MSARYNAFGPYMRKRFGENIYKVNIDAGFTCPNRDGTVAAGGCIYCNNDSFRPSACKPALTVSQQVENGIAYLSKRYKANKFIAYFQPYTNTYAPVEELRKIYGEALGRPEVIGLAIGTRPDTVDEEKIALLEEMAKKYFVLVEYGLQSMYDRSLAYINRGHDYGCFLRAIGLTQGRGIHMGVHLIAGFPTETREETLACAREMSLLPVEFLKIHQLQVVTGTALASMYLNSPFPLYGYEEYLDLVVDFVEKLSPRMVIQRFFATAPDDILIAPKWGKTRQQITRDIEERFIQRKAYQGRCYEKELCAYP